MHLQTSGKGGGGEEQGEGELRGPGDGGMKIV